MSMRMDSVPELTVTRSANKAEHNTRYAIIYPLYFNASYWKIAWIKIKLAHTTISLSPELKTTAPQAYKCLNFSEEKGPTV